MKILHVGKFWPGKGGMERMILDLVNGFSAKGIRCDLLCASAEKGPGTEYLNENAKIICTPTLFTMAATKITPSMIWTLRRICNEYDILHVHHPDPMATLALRMSGYKGKVIVHWHSDILKQKNLLKLYRPLQDWMLNRADLIIGTTPVYIKESPHLVNVSDKMACLPIGVRRVNPDESAVQQIRNRFSGKKIVFSVGRLVGYKGHKYLIDAAKYLPDDYVILLGGSGPLFTALKLQIIESHLEDKVILLGRITDDELPNYYGACDLFCLSSIWKTEAFGMVQIEAMSCGKPVVATQIPASGVSWVNIHEYSGLNVPVEDPEALASAIRDIMSSESVYNSYSQNARKRYEELFTTASMLANCDEIYHKVLNGSAANHGL